MTEEVAENIRKAVYDLIWQTAHLYKDAPGGKLACPQRSKLERYVDSKMMVFDFMLENASGRTELKDVIEDFLRDLESNFHAAVFKESKLLAFYQDRKRQCLHELSI